MDSIKALQDQIIAFRDERDWKQFHNAKDVAMSLSIEAGELLELFLWKSPDAVNREHLKDELADVIYCALLLAHDQELDVSEIVQRKLESTAKKYPVEKVKGLSKKYNEY